MTSRLTYKHTLYACYIGYITQAIINNLTPLLFVTFQNRFDISLSQIGILIFVNFGVQILVDLLGAKYADKIGHRNCMLLAHGAATLGLILLAVLPGLMPNPYVGLLIATSVNAIGGGIIEVLVSPLVEALPLENKASVMSMLHSFYCWGHVAVVLLSTLFFVLTDDSLRLLVPVFWAAVPFLNLLLFFAVPLPPPLAEGKPMPICKLMKNGLFWVLVVLMICAGASEQGMSQWSSYFAEVGLNVNKTLGDLFGPCLFATLMGLSRMVYANFGHKLNLSRFIRWSLVLCVASYLLAVFAPHPVLALCGCALCGFSVGILWPGVFSIAAEQLPMGGTTMFALLALAGDIGCGSGPAVTGLVGAAQTLKDGLLINMLFPLVMLILMITLWIKEKKTA